MAVQWLRYAEAWCRIVVAASLCEAIFRRVVVLCATHTAAATALEGRHLCRPNDSRTGRRTSLQNECAPNKNAMSDFFRLSVLKRNEVFSELLHNWNKTDVFV